MQPSDAVTEELLYKVLDRAYPVGSIYSNVSDDRNPEIILGFGVWEAVAGRVLVGIDASQTEFDTLGETGGHKEMQQHRHLGFYAPDIPLDGAELWIGETGSTASAGNLRVQATQVDANLRTTGTAGSANLPIKGTGNSGNGNAGNLQPYIVVMMWKRTA